MYICIKFNSFYLIWPIMESMSSVNSFWNAMNILITKPHVVNKRLWGQKVIKRFYTKAFTLNTSVFSSKIELSNLQNLDDFLKSINDTLPIQIVNEDQANVEIFFLELLPKSYHEKHAYQLVCLFKNEALVTFHDVTPSENNQNLCPNFAYSFYLCDNHICVKCDCEPNDKSMVWLNTTVLPQVIKWADEHASGYSKSICSESLSLVSSDEYYELYNKLKLKHGKELVQIWPECTDPLKFVYEDIAIATYLLLYWKSVSKNAQYFVDLGCGNGLLVYVLTMEGHNGVGIDVRKRKIWDMYPNNIKLQERTVTPNIDTFPEADWIIGNHSDELTPWLPIIAAKSSYKCNFFLLPCCAYNFDGTKYQRQNSSLSQYTEYLDKIHKLCKQSSFETNIDRLKIPSTKRICFVSNGRTYSISDYDRNLQIILKMVEQEIGLADDNSTQKIKTRDTIEKVKNCTQIDRSIIDYIVECISSYLLKDIDLKSDWEIGKTVKIHELIKIIPEKYLNALKSECGGLQTLLRNNYQIFEIKNGTVKIRYPKTIDEVKSNINRSKQQVPIRMQVKNCWFFNNHPQGCPLESTTCSFLHKKN